MNKLLDIIGNSLPNNEVRRMVIQVLLEKSTNPTQEWIDALSEARKEADQILTDRYWNS